MPLRKESATSVSTSDHSRLFTEQNETSPFTTSPVDYKTTSRDSGTWFSPKRPIDDKLRPTKEPNVGSITVEVLEKEGFKDISLLIDASCNEENKTGENISDPQLIIQRKA